MKNAHLLIALLSVTMVYGQNPCSLNDIFLVRQRTPKFELINELNSNPMIESVYVMPKRLDATSDSDSAITQLLHYKLKDHPCLADAVKEDSGVFGYVDLENDNAVAIKLYSSYLPSKFTSCKANYDRVLALLRQNGKLDSGPHRIVKKEEQVGERYYFWLNQDHVQVEYYFEYTDEARVTIDKYYLQIHRHFAEKK